MSYIYIYLYTGYIYIYIYACKCVNILKCRIIFVFLLNISTTFQNYNFFLIHLIYCNLQPDIGYAIWFAIAYLLWVFHQSSRT